VILKSHDGMALVPSPKRSASPRATSTLEWQVAWKRLTQTYRGRR
jgi:hypothetical protein